jgi:hypothetical protein
MTLLLGDADIRAVREWRPAVAALRGLEPSMDPFREFSTGRHPA